MNHWQLSAGLVLMNSLNTTLEGWKMYLEKSVIWVSVKFSCSCFAAPYREFCTQESAAVYQHNVSDLCYSLLKIQATPGKHQLPVQRYTFYPQPLKHEENAERWWIEVLGFLFLLSPLQTQSGSRPGCSSGAQRDPALLSHKTQSKKLQLQRRWRLTIR